MDGKVYVLVILLVFCLSVIGANAQDSHKITCINQYSHNWMDGVYDLEIQGDYAYLACGYEGLRIVNIANPTAFSDVGHLVADFVNVIAISGNYVFLSATNYRIHIIDIANPESPQEVSHIDLSCMIYSMRISGNHLFVCDALGVRIFDIINPAQPQFIWNSSDNYGGTDVTIQNNHMYVACNESDFRVFDISNINSPQQTGYYGCGDGEWVNGVAVSGEFAYLACGWDGLRVIDLTTMQMVASIDSLAYGFRVKIAGNYAYISYGDPECPLAIVDISNPFSPQTMGIYTPPEDLVNFSVQGNLAYIADFHHGLRLVDIANPANPHEIYSYSKYGNYLGVSVSGNNAFIKENLKFKTIDIADLSHPIDLGYYELPWTYDKAIVSGNIAYLLQEVSATLYAVDISNPAAPELLGSMYTEEGFRHMAICGHYAYLSSHYNGIRIIDIANPQNMQEVGHLDYDDYHYVDFIFGHYAILNNPFALLSIYDLTDPLAPGYVADLDLGGECVDLKESDGYLYAITCHNMLIYDITNFQNWQLLSNTTVLPNNCEASLRALDVNGRQVYLVSDSLGLFVYDVIERQFPQLAGYFRTPGHAYDVAALGNIAIVADSSNIGFYDCSQALTGIEANNSLFPQAFSLSPNYPNPFNAATTIKYAIPKESNVSIDIYDILGRRVETIVSGQKPAGNYQVRWDAGDMPSGTYFFKIQAGEYSETRQMMLLK